MAKTVRIAGRPIGEGQPVFIVAEAGINHNGRLKLAKKLADAAKAAGADAIKFQSYVTERFICSNAFGTQHLGSKKETVPQLLKRLELSASDHEALFRHCRKIGLLIFSTPLDFESARRLERLKVPCFKIASMDLDNLPFLKYLASRGKPLILSTGMGSLPEIEEAVETIRQAGNHELILLHCVSSYPAEPSGLNLRAVGSLAEQFRLPVGFSDHSLGPTASVAAVAVGACLIEKHFTLDRKMDGPDQAMSADPRIFSEMVRQIRMVEAALGDGAKRPTPKERELTPAFRRSIVLRRPLKEGQAIGEGDVEFKRPGTGLSPKELPRVLGRKVRRNLEGDTILTWQELW